MKKYRICKKCAIRHYENCETCFGFGLYDRDAYHPISASDAIEGKLEFPVRPCPECGSTEKGLSK